MIQNTILFDRVSEAGSRPRTERRSIRRNHQDDDSDEEPQSSYSLAPTPSAPPSAPPPASNGSYYSGPFKALYDFESGVLPWIHVHVHFFRMIHYWIFDQ